MAGGVEKMSLDLARGLSEKGHEVTILSLDSELDSSFFEWPNSVAWKRIGIGDPNKVATLPVRLKRIRAIRREVRIVQPHIGIGFQVGSFALFRLSTLGLGIKTIAAERNSPDLFNYIKRGKIKRLLSNMILFTSTRVTVQFESYRFKYPTWLRSHIVCTPNWVPNVSVDKKRKDASNFHIVFIGRLTFQKNVSVLLDAIKLLPDSFEVTIVGDGPDLVNLKSKAAKLKQKIDFLPPQLDIGVIYNSASILCLPSRWEGFPNVVAEALAHGLPVVGFESCSGIPELIIDGSNGVIASGMNDATSLANALLRASKTHFSIMTVKDSVKEFDFPNFVQKWEDSLDI